MNGFQIRAKRRFCPPAAPHTTAGLNIPAAEPIQQRM